MKQSEVARDAGLSQATAGRSISLLEVSGLLLKLRPYHGNVSKRVIKSPKIYFIDPGLVCAVCGYRSRQDVPGPFRGALFESFVLANLLFFRDLVPGMEAGLLLYAGREVVPPAANTVAVPWQALA